MLFANDFNNNRIHIAQTHSNQEYYCPCCGSPLVVRKGELRQHHFAHKSTHRCSDSWMIDSTRSYDMSTWHAEWQSLFPLENQEIVLKVGDTMHRADVMIDKTVIEFQHSILSVQAFDDRNNFYFNFGNKVVWLFDLSDMLANNQISFFKTEKGLRFKWKNPKRAFNNYDIQSGCVDLFFQFGNEEQCLVRVLEVSDAGFESFLTSEFMSKVEFLNYVGLTNNLCLPPNYEMLDENKDYLAFKEKYHICLNRQQERAMLAVEGAVLLLAVPGSGKTTVLITRIGHMIINKGIAPENILSITYNRQAAEEMRERFSALFGKNIGNRVHFKTINAVSLKIYRQHCIKTNKTGREIISEKDRRRLLVQIIKQEYPGEYPSESDIQQLSAAIVYTKNMMLSSTEILEIDEDIPRFSRMFEEYQNSLEEKNLMDFDDQLIFAYQALKNDEELLQEFQKQYKYICVDEAQDTSKIQHAIIRLLAEKGNIFMVGDEDQSIYGFRGAYPRALLNFRYDYQNPYILRMEQNYRSTEQIVKKAQKFISTNKGRYNKNMKAVRGAGEEVKILIVDTREAQYLSLLEIAKNTKNAAFLYRDNESAVVLIDQLDRNQIPFRHRRAEMNFFENKIVKDIVAYLHLVLDEFDWRALKQIRNKGILYLKEKPMSYAIKACKERQLSVYDALDEQMRFVKKEYSNRSKQFRDFMKSIGGLPTREIIAELLRKGYMKYLEEERLDSTKVDILMMLAKQEPDVRKYLNRLKKLETLMQSDFLNDGVVLSTIHTSKGMEYDTVYLVDVYDGRFPSTRSKTTFSPKDAEDVVQEERRLFYVGLTRAINHLFLFKIDNRSSGYLGELFPELYQKSESLKEAKSAERARANSGLNNYGQGYFGYAAMPAGGLAFNTRSILQKAETEEQKRDRIIQEIAPLLLQQERPVIDHKGCRWLICEQCGEIKEEYNFAERGGKGRANRGTCSGCMKGAE